MLSVLLTFTLELALALAGLGVHFAAYILAAEIPAPAKGACTAIVTLRQPLTTHSQTLVDSC